MENTLVVDKSENERIIDRKKSLDDKNKTNEKISKSELKLVSTPRKRKTWEQWSAEETNLFFEALSLFGKNFEKIWNFIRSKRGCLMTRNKEQIRHFYYRTWAKISSYIICNNDQITFKKPYIEILCLLSYGELRRRFSQYDEKKFRKILKEHLSNLVMTGSSWAKVKDRKIKIKLPACDALKNISDYHIDNNTQALSNINECNNTLISNDKSNKKDPTEASSALHDKSNKGNVSNKVNLKVPSLIDICLVPKSPYDWSCIQSLSFNPRIKIKVHPSTKVQDLILILQKRWDTDYYKYHEKYRKFMDENQQIFSQPRPSEERLQSELPQINNCTKRAFNFDISIQPSNVSHPITQHNAIQPNVAQTNNESAELKDISKMTFSRLFVALQGPSKIYLNYSIQLNTSDSGQEKLYIPDYSLNFEDEKKRLYKNLFLLAMTETKPPSIPNYQIIPSVSCNENINNINNTINNTRYLNVDDLTSNTLPVSHPRHNSSISTDIPSIITRTITQPFAIYSPPHLSSQREMPKSEQTSVDDTSYLNYHSPPTSTSNNLNLSPTYEATPKLTNCFFTPPKNVPGTRSISIINSPNLTILRPYPMPQRSLNLPNLPGLPRGSETGMIRSNFHPTPNPNLNPVSAIYIRPFPAAVAGVSNFVSPRYQQPTVPNIRAPRRYRARLKRPSGLIGGFDYHNLQWIAPKVVRHPSYFSVASTNPQCMMPINPMFEVKDSLSSIDRNFVNNHQISTSVFATDNEAPIETKFDPQSKLLSLGPGNYTIRNNSIDQRQTMDFYGKLNIFSPFSSNLRSDIIPDASLPSCSVKLEDLHHLNMTYGSLIKHNDAQQKPTYQMTSESDNFNISSLLDLSLPASLLEEVAAKAFRNTEHIDTKCLESLSDLPQYHPFSEDKLLMNTNDFLMSEDSSLFQGIQFLGGNSMYRTEPTLTIFNGTQPTARATDTTTALLPNISLEYEFNSNQNHLFNTLSLNNDNSLLNNIGEHSNMSFLNFFENLPTAATSIPTGDQLPSMSNTNYNLTAFNEDSPSFKGLIPSDSSQPATPLSSLDTGPFG